ncbi:MAG: 50S ribosomal protein L29 [Puniceicoccales bacterium]|jgi:large subunit ribosomal protein L29|nr:50S ribosomal protein L29 [Puniceicoccales bacterium]
MNKEASNKSAAPKNKAKHAGSSKANDLRDKSVVDLDAILVKAKAELLDLRIRKGSGQLDNPIRLRTLRREIARIHTITSQKKAV